MEKASWWLGLLISPLELSGTSKSVFSSFTMNALSCTDHEQDGDNGCSQNAHVVEIVVRRGSRQREWEKNAPDLQETGKEDIWTIYG